MTMTPTPAPMPALAPADKPLLLLLAPLDDAATEGEGPGVLVKVAMSTTVVAGLDATTNDVTVV